MKRLTIQRKAIFAPRPPGTGSSVPTLFFNIGDAFPADSHLARFVATLATISNDANRSIDEMEGVDDAEPDAGARPLMLFRQQAALYYEAADFLAKSVPRFDALKGFIAALPQDARDDFDRIIAGADPKSPSYLGQWLEDHRNSTFHYREMHPEKSASGQDEVAQAMEAAAEHEGTVFIGDTLGSVRF